MDEVATYSYESLTWEISIEVPEGLILPNPKANRNKFCVKLHKSLYDLKLSEIIWYYRLNEFLLQKDYSKNDDCLCVNKGIPNLISLYHLVYINDFIINVYTRPKHIQNHLKAENLD